MSKGQGISINVIVIAAIALVILVILATLVIRAGSKVSQGTECASLQGTCQAPVNGACPGTMTVDHSGACTNDPATNEQRICCRQIVAT